MTSSSSRKFWNRALVPVTLRTSTEPLYRRLHQNENHSKNLQRAKTRCKAPHKVYDIYNRRVPTVLPTSSQYASGLCRSAGFVLCTDLVEGREYLGLSVVRVQVPYTGDPHYRYVLVPYTGMCKSSQIAHNSLATKKPAGCLYMVSNQYLMVYSKYILSISFPTGKQASTPE